MQDDGELSGHGDNGAPMATCLGHIHSPKPFADPRWLPFLESIGKSPKQLAAIRFTVTLPE